MADKIKCPDCSRQFSSKGALRDHVRAKHTADEEESFAMRAVNAELDHAMGVENDDYDWLVEPYK